MMVKSMYFVFLRAYYYFLHLEKNNSLAVQIWANNCILSFSNVTLLFILVCIYLQRSCFHLWDISSYTATFKNISLILVFHNFSALCKSLFYFNFAFLLVLIIVAWVVLCSSLSRRVTSLRLHLFLHQLSIVLQLRVGFYKTYPPPFMMKDWLAWSVQVLYEQPQLLWVMNTSYVTNTYKYTAYNIINNYNVNMY